jgi:hypothetical protein
MLLMDPSRVLALQLNRMLLVLDQSRLQPNRALSMLLMDPSRLLALQLNRVLLVLDQSRLQPRRVLEMTVTTSPCRKTLLRGYWLRNKRGSGNEMINVS